MQIVKQRDAYFRKTILWFLYYTQHISLVSKAVNISKHCRRVYHPVFTSQFSVYRLTSRKEETSLSLPTTSLWASISIFCLSWSLYATYHRLSLVLPCLFYNSINLIYNQRAKPISQSV